MKTVLLGAGLLAVGVVAGCRNPFASDKLVLLHVSELEAPATVSASANLSVVLTVEVGGCVSFDHIEREKASTGATLTAWGRDAGGKNVSCPAFIASEKHATSFTPPFASEFTVTVNRGRLSPLTAVVAVQ